jgi:hypothetical protein
MDWTYYSVLRLNGIGIACHVGLSLMNAQNYEKKQSKPLLELKSLSIKAVVDKYSYQHP